MLPAELGATARTCRVGRSPTSRSPRAPVHRHHPPFWRQEQLIIEAALAAFGGNIGRAAAALEISPSTIYRKRQAWAGSALG